MELHNILGLFSNQVLLCCITAWFVAQALKIPTYYLVEKKWDWHRFFGSGGMPSSHTAFVVSLTLMIGATQGFDSAIFALSFTMAAIVMYDATGVRRETGKQAVVINEIVQKMFVNGESITDEELKELVGHTHVEVIGGVIVGLLTAGTSVITSVGTSKATPSIVRYMNARIADTIITTHDA